jgi:hypothetical protein
MVAESARLCKSMAEQLPILQPARIPISAIAGNCVGCTVFVCPRDRCAHWHRHSNWIKGEIRNHNLGFARRTRRLHPRLRRGSSRRSSCSATCAGHCQERCEHYYRERHQFSFHLVLLTKLNRSWCFSATQFVSQNLTLRRHPERNERASKALDFGHREALLRSLHPGIPLRAGRTPRS